MASPRGVSARVRVALVGLAFALLARPAAGAPAEIDARVVWVRDSLVYIAARDSLPLDPGDRVTLTVGRRTIATAEITRSFDRALALARIVSGAPPAPNRLDRVRLSVERVASRSRARLRVGIPAAGRASLLYACERVTVRAPDAGYVAESFTDRTTRLVRDTTGGPATLWPDTLAVRQFDDSGDEEIALERGEIDVAVFWPGELSAHLRQQPRWQGFPYGTRAKGVLVAWWAGVAPANRRAPDSATLRSLNEGLFRGDLAPCGAVGATTPDEPIRFAVDPACPGRGAIEPYLNRGAPGGAAPEARLALVDSPGTAPETVRGRLACVYRVRCPVVCGADQRGYVASLGADAFADLMDCVTAASGP